MVPALQVLLDEFQADGRLIGDLHLSRRRLKLCADTFDLSAALSADAIPADAFAGVTRPACEAGEAGAWAQDLARGRLLHALRRHRCALSLDLNVRRSDLSDDPSQHLSFLHAIIVTLGEAAAPQFVLWRPTNVLFSWAEFEACDLPQLRRAGDPETTLHAFLSEANSTRRPSPATSASLPAENLVSNVVVKASLATGVEAACRPHPGAQSGSVERLPRRSSARMFRRGESLKRAPTLPSLDRQQSRLREALTEGEEGEKLPRTLTRRAPRWLWLFGCVLLVISLLVVFPTWSVA
jgi:hypothetical protein